MFISQILIFLCIISAGFSEDSDYTSDFNFPVNGQIPNAATSQYLPVALHSRGATAGSASAASSSLASDYPYRGQEDPYEAQVLLIDFLSITVLRLFILPYFF